MTRPVGLVDADEGLGPIGDRGPVREELADPRQLPAVVVAPDDQPVLPEVAERVVDRGIAVVVPVDERGGRLVVTTEAVVALPPRGTGPRGVESRAPPIPLNIPKLESLLRLENR